MEAKQSHSLAQKKNESELSARSTHMKEIMLVGVQESHLTSENGRGNREAISHIHQ